MEDLLLSNGFIKEENIFIRIEIGLYRNIVTISNTTLTIENERDNIFITKNYSTEEELLQILTEFKIIE